MGTAVPPWSSPPRTQNLLKQQNRPHPAALPLEAESRPGFSAAATWPCDTGPVPRPSDNNNPIISTTCCSSNSYHEPGAECFLQLVSTSYTRTACQARSWLLCIHHLLFPAQPGKGGCCHGLRCQRETLRHWVSKPLAQAHSYSRLELPNPRDAAQLMSLTHKGPSLPELML